MSLFLETMARRSRERVEGAVRVLPLQELSRSAISRPGPRPLGGFGENFDVIAEVKPRSPSEGIFPQRDPAAVAAGYAAGGAAMISVLTEPSEFGGSLRMLEAVSDAVSVPVLAKDFIVDPYQVFEARAAGADGVLVIARMLSDDMIGELLDSAARVGMFCLLEAFDGDDLARISALITGRSEVLVGVNCRDLDTLQVSPAAHQELAGWLPPGRIAVAESAIAGSSDVERVATLGYRGVLIGSVLMRSGDAATLVREMVDAGRRTATVSS